MFKPFVCCLLALLLQGVATVRAQQEVRLEVYFAFNSDELQSEMIQKLDSFNKSVAGQSISKLSVKGHCDHVGTSAINQELSEKRASNVYSYLTNRGLKAESKVLGYGKTQPKYKGNPDRNRRVEILATLGAPEYTVVEKAEDPKLVKTPTGETGETSPGKVDPGEVELGETVVLDGVHFFPGSPTVLPESEGALQDLLQSMEDHPTMQISIEGHVCCQPDYPLSIERAKTVKKFLIANGIKGNRMKVMGFGNTKPVQMEIDEAGRIANRRVEVRVLKK